MPSAMVVVLGLTAGAASVGVIAVCFVFVVLHVAIWRVLPLAVVWAAYLLHARKATAGLEEGLAADAVAALLLVAAAGSLAAQRSNCSFTKGGFALTTALVAFYLAVVQPTWEGAAYSQFYAAGAGLLSAMHLAAPWIGRKLGAPMPQSAAIYY